MAGGVEMSELGDPPWKFICMRCGGRVVEDPATGEWEHAKIDDLVACDMVMRAPERVEARAKDQDDV